METVVLFVVLAVALGGVKWLVSHGVNRTGDVITNAYHKAKESSTPQAPTLLALRYASDPIGQRALALAREKGLVGASVAAAPALSMKAESAAANSAQSSPRKFCPKCGNKLVEGAAFCGKCGNKLD